VNLGFLASGRGSNMQAMIAACRDGRLDAFPAVVISNNESSGALKYAELAKIPYYHFSHKVIPDPDECDARIAETLTKHNVELVILAGYMKKIGPQVLDRFRNQIINIHPSLLPQFGGKGMYGIKVHQAVIEAGVKETGVTIHLVNDEYDQGRILAQQTIQVCKDDTLEILSKRVLDVEHKFYIETISKIIDGKIDLLSR